MIEICEKQFNFCMKIIELWEKYQIIKKIIRNLKKNVKIKRYNFNSDFIILT